jgi:hypothetical protein
MWTAGTPQLHRQPFTAAPPMLRAPCVYCRQQKGHVRQPAGPGPSAAAASPPPPTAAAATRTTSAFAAGAAALVLSLAAAAGAGPGIAAEAPPALTPYQVQKGGGVRPGNSSSRCCCILMFLHMYHLQLACLSVSGPAPSMLAGQASHSSKRQSPCSHSCPLLPLDATCLTFCLYTQHLSNAATISSSSTHLFPPLPGSQAAGVGAHC